MTVAMGNACDVQEVKRSWGRIQSDDDWCILGQSTHPSYKDYRVGSYHPSAGTHRHCGKLSKSQEGDDFGQRRLTTTEILQLVTLRNRDGDNQLNLVGGWISCVIELVFTRSITTTTEYGIAHAIKPGDTQYSC